MAEKISDLHGVHNIGIMAHIDVGRTTTIERISFYTGRSYKVGETRDGASTMDLTAQEQERDIIIQSAATTCFWSRQSHDTKDKFQVNVIDTSGHVDFTTEVERSLCVLDGAVAVSDGEEDVEPQFGAVWRQADKYGIPRIYFISRMDRLGASFYHSIDTIKEKLSATPTVMQLPIGSKNDFTSVIDLVEIQAHVWNDTKELGVKYDTTEIPDDLKDRAQEYHEKLVEAAAEADDGLINKLFRDGSLSKEDIRADVRKLTIAREAFPIFCGSTFKDKSAQPMLDGVVDYLPSPEDVSVIKGCEPGDESVEIDRYPVKSDPFAALVFKISIHPFYGKFVFVRVYPGSVVPDDSVLDSTREKGECIGKISQIHADKENPMDRADTGNIYTFVGLESVTTGDTLRAIGDPITLDSMIFSDPVIQVAIEPKTKADQEKMGIILSKLVGEDPAFQVTIDEESSQTLIAGMDKLQFDIIIGCIRRGFKVKYNQGKPQVAYHETIRKAVMDQGYIHKKQTDGSGQLTKALVNFEPLDTTGGKIFGFENKVTGGHIPIEFIGSIEVGVKGTMEFGVLAGFPVVDVRATVADDQMHPVDSSEMVFKLTGSMCFKEATPKAKPVILEPIMKIEIRTPEEYMGEIISDSNQRRNNTQSMTDDVGVKIIDVKVPLSEIFGYIDDLRFKTQGRAMFTMEMDSYDKMSKSASEKITKARRGE